MLEEFRQGEGHSFKKKLHKKDFSGQKPKKFAFYFNKTLGYSLISGGNSVTVQVYSRQKNETFSWKRCFEMTTQKVGI